MKKTMRRILLLTSMLVMMMAVHAFAAPKLYSARTISFPNQYQAGWSSQFTLTSTSTVTVDVTLSNTNQYAYINSNMNYFIENVYTRARYYLHVQEGSLYNSTYSLSTAYEYGTENGVPAGTYSFGAYYNGNKNQIFKLQFSLYGVGGINVPDALEVMVGTQETVKITIPDGYGNYVSIRSINIYNKAVCSADYDNSTNPSTVTVTGLSIGTTTLVVYGQDGSYDSMTVKVVKYVPAPTLDFKEIKLSGGDKIYNTVFNTDGSVTWSSSNTKVAKVGKLGRITAVGYGKCNIYATTKTNGKTYRLVCKVSVTRTAPKFKAWVLGYNASKKTVRVRIVNLTKLPITVYGKNSRLITLGEDEDVSAINMKLKSGSQVTVGKNKTKTVVFKLKSGSVQDDISNHVARFGFKIDKLNYWCDAFTNFEYTSYAPKNDTNVWYLSYPLD